MAIIDVTVIPIGTNGPSVSEYVADIQDILEEFKKEGQINYKLTPMSTIIEGELPTLLHVVQVIHEAPFQKGMHRVATNIRIDDRRDRSVQMEDKLQSVESKRTIK
ncbi:MTH1187 family thiamine-binding protein [Sutcliffiella rhizosphaerae]|uniref:Thiamine-binding protein domain-containing protein n=1 Tax=Sutcliffiella rhizosphaerae TaxID=2880967 RepID=A0ABN8A3R6_9BACI|nr:MTH1187 family thiamine-binding protein [Sutcliffiella rhizosphaerae]CAG9619294.1 hypothetical protein BACCIP111883_00061 [Sutcliffiella rhizosphaerae]